MPRGHCSVKKHRSTADGKRTGIPAAIPREPLGEASSTAVPGEETVAFFLQCRASVVAAFLSVTGFLSMFTWREEDGEWLGRELLLNRPQQNVWEVGIMYEGACSVWRWGSKNQNPLSLLPGKVSCNLLFCAWEVGYYPKFSLGCKSQEEKYLIYCLVIISSQRKPAKIPCGKKKSDCIVITSKV